MGLIYFEWENCLIVPSRVLGYASGVKPEQSKSINSGTSSRRAFLGGSISAAALTAPGVLFADHHGAEKKDSIIRPPSSGKQILLSPKLGMIPKELDGKKLTLTERLSLAGEAGFDGVDFDQAGEHTEEEAREAVKKSGVFVHNAINHAHWSKRLTSANEEDRKQGVENISHCIRVSHAAGGNGVLIVIGSGSDGDEDEIVERGSHEIRSLIPLAASQYYLKMCGTGCFTTTMLHRNRGHKSSLSLSTVSIPSGLVCIMILETIGNMVARRNGSEDLAGAVSNWMSKASAGNKINLQISEKVTSHGSRFRTPFTISTLPGGQQPKSGAETWNASLKSENKWKKHSVSDLNHTFHSINFQKCFTDVTHFFFYLSIGPDHLDCESDRVNTGLNILRYCNTEGFRIPGVHSE